MSRHPFRFRSHNMEHTGSMDDEVAEMFSVLISLQADNDPAVAVDALKAAARELLPAFAVGGDE